MRRMPANSGLFYSRAESPVFQIENVARLGGLSPERKFPFLAPEKCGAGTFTLLGVGWETRHMYWVAPILTNLGR
jgi:hypothetical protein